MGPAREKYAISILGRIRKLTAKAQFQMAATVYMYLWYIDRSMNSLSRESEGNRLFI